MSIIKKIKTAMCGGDKNSHLKVSPIVMSMGEREKSIYDDEHLRLQKLYEKWICKDKWLLHQEGIPLLFGINPDASEPDSGVSDKIEELWKHAQDCVQKKLLSIVNIENPSDQWEVLPIDLYRWAMVSRISVPDQFSTLIAFVIQTVKPEQNKPTHIAGEEDSALQKHKELVLGAATSLLVNAAEQCKNDEGKVVASKISKLIIENKQEWFEQDEPLLTESAIIELLNNYIRLTSPII